MTYQRGFWKLAGIMVIVGVALGLLVSVAMGIFGATMVMKGGVDIPLDEGAFDTSDFELD